MITVRDAASSAINFAQGLLDEARARDLRLEEVEFNKQPPRWFITLSMPAVKNFGFSREYKAFTVDADTGEVLSMKIRELAGAS